MRKGRAKMSKYTAELRYIVEDTEIFDFPYTFFREEEKPEFERKFIQHFYFREIGTETVARFKHYLRMVFDEKLPYYNELLELTLYDYDLKNNYDLTETFERTKSGSKNATGNSEQSGTTSENSATTDNKLSEFSSNINLEEENKADNTETASQDNRQVSSDTPTGLLAMSNIKGNVYASKADIADNKTITETDNKHTKESESKEQSQGSDSIERNTETTGNANSQAATTTSENDQETETYTLSKTGDIGVETTPQKLMKHIELQKILLRVYEQFFNECEELFMGVY